MTEKRFYLMNVEDPYHEYGRWCKPVLEDGKTGEQYEHALDVMDLLNALYDENKELKQQIGELQYSKKMLRATNKDLELGIHNLRKSFEELDNMRIKHIKFLQKRMKKHGISIYYNDDGDDGND